MANKIRKIEFEKSEVFKDNSQLTLFSSELSADEIPRFFFLVGNNGSGKTTILNYFFNGLGEGRKGYYGSTSLKEGTKFKIYLSEAENPIKSEVNSSGIRNSEYPSDIKIIYDIINTDFKIEKITSATAITADEEIQPKEKNENLGKIIPQLLVNIKAEDDAYIADFVLENNSIPEYKRKLERFTDAFESMYDGSKKFKGIINQNGEKKIIFADSGGNDVDLDSFSTGEKQIIFRVGNLLKNLGRLDNGIILIDEPETSLHPRWQKKYLNFLKQTFNGLDIQFIIATHSPYILQGIDDRSSIVLKLSREGIDNGLEIGKRIGYYPNSLKNPSLNLINYLAYNIIDELLHIELFAALEIKNYVGYRGLKDIMRNNSSIPTKQFISTQRFNGVNIGDNVTEPLPIFIRNAIHHPEETARNYNESELKTSIDTMLSMLK